MKFKPIDVDLCQRLFYIKDDLLYNKIDRNSRAKADELVGYVRYDSSSGRTYLVTKIDGIMYNVHRIMWAMYYGRDPGNVEIDHKDHSAVVDFRDTKIASHAKSNLRLANRSQQNHNRLRKGEPPTGCTWDDKRKKWRSRIGNEGRQVTLGWFDSKDEANAVYIKAKNEVAGRFTPSEIRFA